MATRMTSSQNFFFSFPVIIKDGKWKFVEDYKISAEMRNMLEATEKELEDEREWAEKCCK